MQHATSELAATVLKYADTQVNKRLFRLYLDTEVEVKSPKSFPVSTVLLNP
jgi:hypothetical protein